MIRGCRMAVGGAIMFTTRRNATESSASLCAAMCSFPMYQFMNWPNARAPAFGVREPQVIANRHLPRPSRIGFTFLKKRCASRTSPSTRQACKTSASLLLGQERHPVHVHTQHDQLTSELLG